MIAARAARTPHPRVEQLRRLSDIGRALTYTTSPAEVAQLTVERGAKLVNATAAVLLMEAADEHLHVLAAHGVSPERLAQFHAPLSDDVINGLQGLLSGPEDRFVAVPLVVGGAVTGLFAVTLPRAAVEADEWLISSLGDQAAGALERARLGGEVRLEMESRLLASQGATSAKDRALATLAHDIRSPLGAIDGYCALLQEEIYGPITDKQREGIGRIQMSGRHLLSLLDNVLDMARLSAGASTVHQAPMALTETAREAVDMLMPASLAKHQVLAVRGEPVDVMADVARVRQVLVNLIGNAVKFTPAGGSIVVQVGVSEHGGESWGEVRVTDTGPGIGDADRPSVFEPFYRGEGAASVPGVGLGLAISHTLVTQMGGRLDLESALGAGSSFIVRLAPVERRTGKHE